MLKVGWLHRDDHSQRFPSRVGVTVSGIGEDSRTEIRQEAVERREESPAYAAVVSFTMYCSRQSA